MILSGGKIREEVLDNAIGIVPFQVENLKDASYTFTLSSKIRCPQQASIVSLETDNLSDDLEIGPDGFVLDPNAFILGYTEENLKLNGKFGCFFSARGSCAQIGLNLLLSSTFAEPDTDGKITLEIHNASNSPILLRAGMKIVKGIFLRVE